MTRINHIRWLSEQDTIHVDIQTLEELKAESDSLHDAVLTIVSFVICSDDDSYDLVEGSHFPLRIKLSEAGIVVLAPNIYAAFPGQSQIVKGEVEWKELTDHELEDMGNLVLELQKRHQPLPEIHMDEVVAEQDGLVAYRVRHRRPELGDEVDELLWDWDVPQIEWHIKKMFGERLVALERIGHMTI